MEALILSGPEMKASQHISEEHQDYLGHKMKNTKQIIDTEKVLLSASRGEKFEDSGLPDTKENRELFRMLLAETDKMMRNGTDVSIPV